MLPTRETDKIFVALEIPGVIDAILDEWKQEQSGPPHWMRHPVIRITADFTVTKDKLTEVCRALRECTCKQQKFVMEPGETTLSDDTDRIIALVYKAGDHLVNLQEKVTRKLGISATRPCQPIMILTKWRGGPETRKMQLEDPPIMKVPISVVSLVRETCIGYNCFNYREGYFQLETQIKSPANL